MKYLLLVAAASLAHASPAFADEDKKPEMPLFVEKVEATSTFASKNNAYDPRLVVDPKTGYDKNSERVVKSAWCEGKKDAGIGESLTVTFAVPTKIATVEISAGVWMTEKLFKANNIPTAITITTDDKRTFTAKPSATERKDAELTIGGAPVKTMTFTIAEVKPGTMNDSCISEISFGEATIVTGVDAAGANSYLASRKSIVETLWKVTGNTVDAGCDPALIAKYIELPFVFDDLENTHSSNEDLRFVHHKKTAKDIATFTKLCKRGIFTSSEVEEEMMSDGPGGVSLQFMGAETMQSIHLRYKKGAWKAYSLE